MPQLNVELRKAFVSYAAKSFLFFALLVVVVVAPLLALVRCA